MPWILAVIPARGGSKGIPRKNIRLLAGKPLIEYTLEEVRRSRLIDRVVVSTDDLEITQVCASLGAEVIIRPAELALDTSPTEDSLIHAIHCLSEKDGYRPDIVVTLEPTSPLRTYQLIDRCVAALLESELDSVISVTETRECFGRIAGGRFEYLFRNQPRRRQDREPLYKESSTVYVTRADTLMRLRSVLGERVGAVVADADEAIDINEPIDFAIAEAVIRWRQEVPRL